MKSECYIDRNAILSIDVNLIRPNLMPEQHLVCFIFLANQQIFTFVLTHKMNCFHAYKKMVK